METIEVLNKRSISLDGTRKVTVADYEDGSVGIELFIVNDTVMTITRCRISEDAAGAIATLLGDKTAGSVERCASQDGIEVRMRWVAVKADAMIAQRDK